MSDVVRMVAFVEETWSRFVVPVLGDTILQLHEWTGEFPGAASGAPPPTLSGSGSSGDGDEPAVRLTKVEADAARPDDARRALARVYELVDLMVIESESLSRSTGVVSLPPPSSHRLAPKLAFVQWHLNQCVRGRVPADRRKQVKVAVRLVGELADICQSFRPAPKPKLIDVCHAHEKAGAHQPIDANHRRWHLCRWCGDFRRAHGVNPPPELVRLHDRGINITATNLRKSGILK